LGYTHYWEKKDEIDEKEYSAALKDIASIVRKQKEVKLSDGSGDQGKKPTLTGGISFNGLDEKSHESFVLPKTASSMEKFDFCKTAQKPYDIVVVAALARLAEVKGIEVSSDGRPDDWEDGVKLASTILGRKVQNPLNKKALSLVKSSYMEKIKKLSKP